MRNCGTLPRSCLAVAVAFVAFVLTTSNAQAQRTDTTKQQVNARGAGATGGEPTVVETVTLADQLARYGRSAQSALALITAAQILIDHPERPLDVQPQRGEMRGAPSDTGAKTARGQPQLNARTLLSEAESMAAGNQNVLAMIQQLRQRAQAAPRGAVGGPRVATGAVGAFRTVYYMVPFRGGERAAVAVVGDGDTDLDLYVFDENGNLVAFDDNLSDQSLAVWYPRWTGPFRIEIRNLGRVYNVYALRTN